MELVRRVLARLGDRDFLAVASRESRWKGRIQEACKAYLDARYAQKHGKPEQLATALGLVYRARWSVRESLDAAGAPAQGTRQRLWWETALALIAEASFGILRRELYSPTTRPSPSFVPDT